jgi:tetratricopeptide (TPR) repeat protein
VGDVLVRQSNFAAALSSYREGLEIIDRLAKSDPDNAGWQRDLSVSFSLMGTAQAAKGDLADALKSFRDCDANGERLTKSDPNNTGWQSELSNSYNNIGTVLQLQGNPASALTFYRNGLAISQRLAALDPTNTRWRYNEEFFIRKIGRSSYSLVLAHDYANALAAVDQAISLAGEQTWLDANRAHALMFLGRIDEARDLYLKYRGRQIPEAKGNTWEAVVLGDFAEFRKAGLSSSLMDEVDKKFQLASIRAN